MSYSFGIFPFRMAYRRNSKTHAHSEPEYFTSKYCGWIFSDNMKFWNVRGRSRRPPLSRGKRSTETHMHAPGNVSASSRWFHGLRGKLLGTQPHVCSYVGGYIWSSDWKTYEAFTPFQFRFIWIWPLLYYLKEQSCALVNWSFILFPFCDRDTGTWLLCVL